MSELTDKSLCIGCHKRAIDWIVVGFGKQSWCGEEECKEKTLQKQKEKDEKPKQYIELDCPPGPPRPGDLIADVIRGSGLNLKETSGRFMGNWRWDYSDVSPEIWKKAVKIIKPRIKELYNTGRIRYGSW